jgi:hypothetical protein
LRDRTPVRVQVGGKPRVYFRVAPDQPLEVEVQGPARFEVVARADLAGGAHGAHVLVREGGRELGSVSGRAHAAKQVRLAAGGPVGAGSTLALDLPRGRHRLVLAVSGSGAAYVRMRRNTASAGSGMVSLAPIEAARSVLLAQGEKTIPYYSITARHPVELRVVGPVMLDLITRLDFDTTMRGEVRYRVVVSEGGRTVHEIVVTTTKATTATWSNAPDVVPSKLNRVTLPIGAGSHDLVLTLTEPASGSVAVHARIPALLPQKED